MSRLIQPRLAGGLVALTTFACASVRYDAGYDSKLKIQSLPLDVSVAVLVDPELREGWSDKDPRLEKLRESMSDALAKDFSANGPVNPVASNPEARLDVVITKAKSRDVKLYAMMWFFAPTWLFGVPYHRVALDLEVSVRLTGARGGILFESQLAAECSQLEGLYYGHDDLSFGCAVKEIAESMRQKISMRRSAILAGVERTRPPPVAPPPVAPPPPTLAARAVAPPTPKAPSVAAVFLIRDMSGTFEPLILDQLTEYLAVQMTQHLGYQVVPRAQLRAQINETKAESFKACYDDACQIELGKAVAASKSVSTTLIKIGSRCAVNTTVYDLRTEAAERAAGVETACGEDALLDGVTRVVQEMLRPPAS